MLQTKKKYFDIDIFFEYILLMNIHSHKTQYSVIQITIFYMTLLLPPFACIFPSAASLSSQATPLLSLPDEMQGVSFCSVNKASVAIR